MNTDDNLTEETHAQARREFVDQAALLAMQEIVRAGHFHPTDPVMIATCAYDLAVEMTKQREEAHIELMSSIY